MTDAELDLPPEEKKTVLAKKLAELRADLEVRVSRSLRVCVFRCVSVCVCVSVFVSSDCSLGDSPSLRKSKKIEQHWNVYVTFLATPTVRRLLSPRARKW